jgi:exopolyphosphatase/pppGpp-phosphohydrolase
MNNFSITRLNNHTNSEFIRFGAENKKLSTEVAFSSPIISKQLYEKANGFVHQLPLRSLQQPLYYIELGSRMIRVIIIPGKNGPVHQPYFASYPSPLAQSLEANNGYISREARQKLSDTFKQIKWNLPDAVNIEDFTCVATSGIRDATNQPDMVLFLKKHVGLSKLEILSAEREADLSYLGTLRGLKKAEMQKNLVVDIGSGSIQFALGTGTSHIEKDSSLAMPVGAHRIRLKDPFDYSDVKMSRVYVSDKLEQLLPFKIRLAAEGRHAYIHGSRIFQVLKKVHEHYFKTPLLNENNALSREVVDYYLSPDGIKLLKKAYQEDGSFYDDLIRAIPRNLIILSVLMDKMKIDEFRFGEASCLRAAYLQEAAEKQLEQTLTPLAQKLSDVYKQALPKVVDDFKSIFSDFESNFAVRSKTAQSILDKLLKGCLKNKDSSLIDWHRLEDVTSYVNDGVGVRTIQLPYTRDAFVQSLKRLLTEKGYVPRRYTNYESQDGLSYLSQELLDTHFKPEKDSTQKLNRFREVIRRSNNYMTTQLYFQPPNTKAYFVELQVRGPEVNRIAEAEHVFYHLRRKKSLHTDNPEFDRLINDVAKKINSLTKRQLLSYERYLAESYKVARLREKNEEAFYPPLPEGINPLLEINHLRMIKARLISTQRREATK